MLWNCQGPMEALRWFFCPIAALSALLPRCLGALLRMRSNKRTSFHQQVITICVASITLRLPSWPRRRGAGSRSTTHSKQTKAMLRSMKTSSVSQTRCLSASAVFLRQVLDLPSLKMMAMITTLRHARGLQMERRHFLKDCAVTGASAVACSTGLLTSSIAFATESDPFQATSVEAVLAALGVDSPKESGEIKITAPKIAENGASVPVVITSILQGTTEILTIVAKNPKPLAARNKFGKRAIPSISSRIKMGETTDVIAIVKADEKYYMAKTNVKVTLGGCGG